MTSVELLADCRARHIVLTARDGRLEIDAPEQELTVELLQLLRMHKTKLMELVQSRNKTTTAETSAPVPVAAEPAEAPVFSGFDFPRWVRRPDVSGRMGWEAPDLPERERWWAHPERIIDPDPCERCGSLEVWQDLAGGWHCQHCEADTLARGERLARLAMTLRNRGPRRASQ